MSITKHIENLCAIGARHAGYGGDLKAAAYLENEFQNYGLNNVQREEFSCTAWEFSNCYAQIILHNGEKRNLEMLPYYYSGSTPEEGLTGEVLYIESFGLLDALKNEIENKIVLINEEDIEIEEHYSKLLEYKAKAILLITGGENPIVGVLWLFRRILKYKRLPVLSIKYRDAEFILNEGINTIFIKSDTDLKVGAYTCNVTGQILTKGAAKHILIGAHYDTVPLPHAAGDNTVGTAMLLELAETLSGLDLKKYNIHFSAFSAEELDREGAQNYVLRHAVSLKDTCLMIYFDGNGALIGKNMFQVIGEDRLTIFCREIAKMQGYPVTVENGNITYLDHAYVSSCGVPSIYIGRGPLKAWHTRCDTPDTISEAQVLKTINYIKAFITFLDQSQTDIDWVIDDIMSLKLKKGLDDLSISDI